MELYIPPKRLERNPITGEYLKGLTPHNKGKKWDEWLNKENQEKVLQNLAKYRKKGNPAIGGWNKKAVIATDDEGKILGWFCSALDASLKTGICNRNILKCCHGTRKHAGGVRWEFA